MTLRKFTLAVPFLLAVILVVVTAGPVPQAEADSHPTIAACNNAFPNKSYLPKPSVTVTYGDSTDGNGDSNHQKAQRDACWVPGARSPVQAFTK